MYPDFEILKAFLLILRRSGFGKNGLPYNISVRGQPTPINYCFDILRKFLPEEFKDKSNKEILKYLRKDPRSAERLVATHFRLEEAQELMQALEEEPVATAEASGQPTPTGQEVPPVGATGAPIGGLPSAPSISTPQIPIRMPKAPVPEPEIAKLYVADKGGTIVGERSIAPTSVRSVSQGPSEIVLTDRNDKTIGKLSANPTAKISDSELHIDKNGNITETPTHGPSAPAQTPQPRLIVTGRYGNIAPEPLKRPETAKLFTQDKNNIIREHTVKPPSRFSVLRSRFSSFASPLMNKIAGSAGPAIKKGLGGIGRGIMGIGRDGLQAAAPALGRTFNKGLDGLDRLTNPRRPNFRKRPKLASKFTTGRKVALAIALFFIVFMGALVIPPGGTVPTGQAAPLPITPTPSNNLNSCKFTRSGVSNLIKSSTLSSFFSEVAAKTNVPAAALASLAMHETASFVVGTDNNHDAFGSNITTAAGCAHFATSPTGALGLMQIQPPKHIHDILAASGAAPSFESVGAYSADGVGRGAGFIGKTAGSLTLQDLCDVKTSIYLGAGVLISKNGGKPPTTGAEINKSICGYYGSCVYGQHNYGDEAQKDFENCKPTAGTTPTPPGPIGVSLTCPLDGNPTITCGTAANPASTGCGHGVPPIYAARCNPYYYACDTLSTKYSDGTYEKYSPGLYYAIDVTGRNEVKLPYINGNESVVWTRAESQPIYIGKNAEWGYRINFTTTYQGKKLYLDLTHLSAGLNNAASLNSGEIVGRHIETNQINHLHIGLSIDGQWVEPAQQAKMCVQ